MRKWAEDWEEGDRYVTRPSSMGESGGARSGDGGGASPTRVKLGSPPSAPVVDLMSLKGGGKSPMGSRKWEGGNGRIGSGIGIAIEA